MTLKLTKMKVLAVDDNRTNLHILQVFLKKQDYASNDKCGSSPGVPGADHRRNWFQ